MIKEIKTDEDIKSSVEVIRGAFRTVAQDFNLTEENCPTNAAFIAEEHLLQLHEKGVLLFGIYADNRQIGFVALEKATETTFYLEKLAVLPEYRHRGAGRRLMDFGIEYVKSKAGKIISIGIINENTILKDWYIGYGFIEKETRIYPHLPFTVCIMEKGL